MPFSDILYILAVGFWGPVFFLAICYWAFYGRYRSYRSDGPFQYENREMRDMVHTLQRQSEQFQRYSPRIFEELPALIESRLSDRLGRDVREAIGLLQTNPAAQGTEVDLRQESTKQLIRELGHSLNTPLSQIEASLLVLRARSSELEPANLNVGKSFDTLFASVDICKAVLAAFREMVVVTSSSSGWSPSSIPEALRAASGVYMASHSKSLAINLNIAANIPGYSSNFIVALVLPLLENAIEASPDNENVSLVGRIQDHSLEILVTNRLQQPLPNHDIYEHGFTTKESHDGIGLSTVKHLISGLRGAHVRHFVEDDNVTFAVLLPVRG
jgi:signal transduction histidine kinase